MNKAENAILAAKNPDAYIEASLKSKLSPADKARLAKVWMRTTGYTAQDILKARNRHPFWKMKKMEGAAERTRKRLAEHDYSAGGEVVWTPVLVGEFLGMNGKDETGHYKNKDWQIAEHFRTTIPSIQYMRRKLAKVTGMLGKYASRTKVIEYLCHAESVLAKGPEAVVESRLRPRNGTPPGDGKGIPAKSSVPKPVSSMRPAVATYSSDVPGRTKSDVLKRKPAFGVKPASGRKPVERVVEKHEEWSTKSKGSLPHQPRGGKKTGKPMEPGAKTVVKNRKPASDERTRVRSAAPVKRATVKKDRSETGSKYYGDSTKTTRLSTHSKKSRSSKK